MPENSRTTTFQLTPEQILDMQTCGETTVGALHVGIDLSNETRSDWHTSSGELLPETLRPDQVPEMHPLTSPGIRDEFDVAINRGQIRIHPNNGRIDARDYRRWTEEQRIASQVYPENRPRPIAVDESDRPQSILNSLGPNLPGEWELSHALEAARIFEVEVCLVTRNKYKAAVTRHRNAARYPGVGRRELDNECRRDYDRYERLDEEGRRIHGLDTIRSST